MVKTYMTYMFKNQFDLRANFLQHNHKLVILKGSHVMLDAVFPWFAGDAYSMTNLTIKLI
jgi:hypothetical protein